MQIETQPDSRKQSEMLKHLQQGTVMLFVDSRQPNVCVPDYLKNDFQLRLNYDYAYQISDFQVFSDRVEASLSFNHQNYFCVVPFESVYLMVSHATEKASLFIHSVPVEMLDFFSQESKKQQKEQEVKERRAGVKVVSAQIKETATGLKSHRAKKTKKTSGHLRVVK